MHSALDHIDLVHVVICAPAHELQRAPPCSIAGPAGQWTPRAGHVLPACSRANNGRLNLDSTIKRSMAAESYPIDAAQHTSTKPALAIRRQRGKPLVEMNQSSASPTSAVTPSTSTRSITPRLPYSRAPEAFAGAPTGAPPPLIDAKYAAMSALLNLPSDGLSYRLCSVPARGRLFTCHFERRNSLATSWRVKNIGRSAVCLFIGSECRDLGCHCNVLLARHGWGTGPDRGCDLQSVSSPKSLF